MYGTITGLELAFALIGFLIAWLTGNKASNLVYSGSSDRLRRKMAGLLVWTCASALSALVVLLAIGWIMANQPAVFWEDRLLIHAPLIAVPQLAVWCYSVPKLWRWKRGLLRSQDAPDPKLLADLAAPGTVLPFQAAAAGMGTVFYFLLVAPFPLGPLDVFTPLLVCLLTLAGLWMLHDRRWQRISRSAPPVSRSRRRTFGKLAALCGAAAAAGIAFYAGMWESRLPDRLNMATGPMDFGTGTILSHDESRAVSIAMLTGPRDEIPDRRIELVAEKTTVRLASGKTIDAWTFNGELPGPELRFKHNELVEVTLTNRNIEEGVTIHWHGLDVPNAEDGVAGATQDAVMPGQSHKYRFRAEQVGTFWYHSHQHSAEAVSKGLFGALIVEPADENQDSAPQKDLTVMTHIWDGTGFTIGADEGIRRETVAPGTSVRLRLINTDNWVRQTYNLQGTPFRVSAIDGTELHEPGELRDTELQLTTGGRYDVTFTMPDHPVYLKVGSGRELGLLMSPDGSGEVPAASEPAAVFDPTHYGTRTAIPFGADSAFDREFTMTIDNNLGFYDGKMGMVYTLNGDVFPDTPMFMVREGELVKVKIVNRGSVDHPMHLHGHHALVLSRNGEPADGSPWWTDTLDVQPGESYEIAFRADNPGIWMDHCHNLTHAEIGMSMHLMYEGFTTLYTIGRESDNHPE